MEYKNGLSMNSVNIYGLEKEQALFRKRINFKFHIYNDDHYDIDDHGNKIKTPMIIKHGIRNNTIYASSIDGIPYDAILDELVQNKESYKTLIVFYIAITNYNPLEVFHKKIYYNSITNKVDVVDIESSLHDYNKEFDDIFNKLRKKE